MCLFSVLWYESVIYEFDFYFNYCIILYLIEKGFLEFWNWFDYESWYLLGCIVGGILYFGFMVMVVIIYWMLCFFSFVVYIKDVCVFMVFFFVFNIVMVVYFFGIEFRDWGMGFVVVILLVICFGYIFCFVVGLYDNEVVVIFVFVFIFYLFVKVVNMGLLVWFLFLVFVYFYMVFVWGGYIFIINFLLIYVLVLLVIG